VSEAGKWAFITVWRTNGLPAGERELRDLDERHGVPGTDFVPTNGTVSFDAGVNLATSRCACWTTSSQRCQDGGIDVERSQGGASLAAHQRGAHHSERRRQHRRAVSVGVHSAHEQLRARATVQGRFILTNQAGPFHGIRLFFNGGSDGTSRASSAGISVPVAPSPAPSPTRQALRHLQRFCGQWPLQASIQGRDRAVPAPSAAPCRQPLCASQQRVCPATLGGARSG